METGLGKKGDSMDARGIVGILLALLVIFGLWYTFTIAQNLASTFNPPSNKNSVTVTGSVKTDFGTSPVTINFTSESSGTKFSATINQNGQYSVSLLGPDTYNVTVYYKGAFGISTSPNCSSHTLTLNSSVTSMPYNITC